MEKITKLQFLKFFCALILFCAFVVLFFFKEGNLITAFQLTLLCWSFYVLCIPGFHGKITLGVPFKLLTGKTLFYPEAYMWLAALCLNLFFTTFDITIYFKTLATHILYQILITPWPCWLIIFISSLGTFYRFLFGYKNFYSKPVLHSSIRTLMICAGLFTFIYFSYKELIILINVRA